ncbi:hemerythrin domain-containing protein [Roseivivax sp. GX 12232]|uniref:hemerythrin domain-containing protein n=1 Tax=Roseivivax sp. GX 12232 TaxID=2900547 RepID=UPI001E49EA47|nr:hemerythrin domain-containing protein [Roseivivax sp. GX 12232]MCE0505303.1 hemerythrin domain-containing protein [Roseivivax sp. GX 12232]
MSATIEDELRLARRTQLPDALRVLLAEFPRSGWEAHPHFQGLVQFWLGRHGMFREIVAALKSDAEAAMDGKLEGRARDARLSRYGGALVNELHGHHQIEDHHYFPVLVGLDARIKRGFDILDRDHDDMDGLLDRFARGANGVLRGELETGRFREELLGFEALLDRHLNDEEELIVPVILKNGPGGLH